jgi:hypothetical protein
MYSCEFRSVHIELRFIPQILMTCFICRCAVYSRSDFSLNVCCDVMAKIVSCAGISKSVGSGVGYVENRVVKKQITTYKVTAIK